MLYTLLHLTLYSWISIYDQCSLNLAIIQKDWDSFYQTSGNPTLFNKNNTITINDVTNRYNVYIRDCIYIEIKQKIISIFYTNSEHRCLIEECKFISCEPSSSDILWRNSGHIVINQCNFDSTKGGENSAILVMVDRYSKDYLLESSITYINGGNFALSMSSFRCYEVNNTLNSCKYVSCGSFVLNNEHGFIDYCQYVNNTQTSSIKHYEDGTCSLFLSEVS